MPEKISINVDNFANDRRREERTTSVFIPALLEIEDFAGFCLVRNLSPSGMMASVFAQFAPDQSVTVQFKDDYAVPGLIAWSEDERIGVEFAWEIDVDAVFREQGTGHIGEMVKRPPRLPIDCDGELTVQDRVLPVRILNISQRGTSVVGALARVGDEVEVRLPDMEPRKALVRWAQSGTMGLNFLRPFGFAELAEWVVGQQAGQTQV